MYAWRGVGCGEWVNKGCSCSVESHMPPMFVCAHIVYACTHVCVCGGWVGWVVEQEDGHRPSLVGLGGGGGGMRMHNQGAGVFSDDAPVRKEVCMCVRACVYRAQGDHVCECLCVCMCGSQGGILVRVACCWGYHLWMHVPFIYMNTCTDYEYMRRACGIIYGCMCRVWGI